MRLYPILFVICWSMTLASEGRNPKLRHDGTDFDLELDSKRIERADTSNHVVVARCEYRGDWPALCEICGLRNWKHKSKPCLCCEVDRDHLLSIQDMTLDADLDAYKAFTNEDYHAEVGRCRIVS